MLKSINPKQLFQLLDKNEKDHQFHVDHFRRVQNVYNQIFSARNSTWIDFNSFTIEDIEDTLEDLSCYNTEEEDNSGVVLYDLNRLITIREELIKLPPQKVHTDFF